jgi:hypothetical protein
MSGTCVLGNDTNSAVKLNTGSTTGDAAAELPTGSIGSGEILDGAVATVDLGTNVVTADKFATATETLFFCGESCNNSTCAGGHSVELLAGANTVDHTLAAAACDTLGETSIAAASEAVSADTAFKVRGMRCITDSSGSNGVVLAMTIADAATVPPITCTIATGATECTSIQSSITNAAAAAVVAVSIVTTEDLSGNDFNCRVYISWK